MIKIDELGELFLGLAVVVYVLDLLMQHYRLQPITLTRRLALTGPLLRVIAVLSTGFTIKYPSWQARCLNVTAARDYPRRGMYDQTSTLFQFIYDHPRYLLPTTRLNHAKMLLEMGREAETDGLLRVAASDLNAVLSSGSRRCEHLRHLAMAHSLIGQSQLAEANFNEAMKLARSKCLLSCIDQWLNAPWELP